MKAMVCVDLSKHSLNLFKDKLKNWNWNNITELHLVHGFQLQVYADNFFFNAYPTEDQYEEIKKSVQELLEDLEKEIQGDFPIIKECIISTTPTMALAEYAKEKGVHEMIIGTRGNHGISGFFDNSFAEYMVRHAHCELRIIRAGF